MKASDDVLDYPRFQLVVTGWDMPYPDRIIPVWVRNPERLEKQTSLIYTKSFMDAEDPPYLKTDDQDVVVFYPNRVEVLN